ncbi:MAG: hypothetical protein RR458_00185 [Clostridia bacterium]
MLEIKVVIETPDAPVSDGMWVQIYKAFEKDGTRSHQIILDSDEKLHSSVEKGEMIRIECSVTMDDAYVFSKLQVNGKDIHIGEVITVNENLEIFAKSVYIDYKLYNSNKNVVVKKDGIILKDKSVLHYGDEISIEFNADELLVNRKTYLKSPIELTAYSDIVIK